AYWPGPYALWRRRSSPSGRHGRSSRPCSTGWLKPPRLRGLFVTGTGTGVGKTVVAGALCAALAARGERVAAFKPVVTGLDEDPDQIWPRDHELLAQVASAGQSPGDVAPLTFGPPVSPHFAAEEAGATIEP